MSQEDNLLLSTLSFLLEFKVSHDRSVSSLELVKSNCNTPWRHFVSKKKESWNQAKKKSSRCGMRNESFLYANLHFVCVCDHHMAKLRIRILIPIKKSSKLKWERDVSRSTTCSCVTLRILIAAARQDRHHHKNAKASAKKFSVKRRIKLFGTMIFPVRVCYF